MPEQLKAVFAKLNSPFKAAVAWLAAHPKGAFIIITALVVAHLFVR
jgi:hypothetical protein